MRFRLKTFQGNPQKGNSSSSGPYEPGRSYRPVIIASRGQNKNCSQRHAKVERSMNVMRRGVTEPVV